uniref:CCAAT-binding factor domain-containing protein n=1 Tax=Octactis speculum TaxID=3111310 RepID=A0A7S2GHA6_9STRA
MALSSLFILMQCHNLDYPDFYGSLYRALKPSVFHAKHRARFFRLLALCLSSTALPAYLICAFVKKLNRLALSAPPSGALYALALTRSLLEKNSECMALIQREKHCEDGFDPEESDPKKCGSLETSLWEIVALQEHYYPAVAALAKDFKNTKWGKHHGKHDHKDDSQLSLDDYAAYTYKQIFDQEAQRSERGKNAAVPLCFKEPSGIFVPGDALHDSFSLT